MDNRGIDIVDAGAQISNSRRGISDIRHYIPSLCEPHWHYRLPGRSVKNAPSVRMTDAFVEALSWRRLGSVLISRRPVWTAIDGRLDQQQEHWLTPVTLGMVERRLCIHEAFHSS